MIEIIGAIAAVITLIIALIKFCYASEAKRFFNKVGPLPVRVFSWLINVIKKKRPVEIRIAGITTNSCSFCSSKSPTRAVHLENGEQIHVCQECLNKQLKSRIWKQKANSEV